MKSKSTLSKSMVVSFLFSFLSIFVLGASAHAQGNGQNAWAEIHKVDALLVKSKVTWKRIYSSLPVPSLDVAKLSALSAEKARVQGMDAKSTEETLTQAKQRVFLEQQGYVQSATLRFEHNSDATYCDVTEEMPHLHNASSNQADFGHTIDYFDGLNAVSLMGVGPSTPIAGVLTRDRNEALNYCAHGFGEPIFLVGTPITSVFEQINSSLVLDPNGFCIIERVVGQNDSALRYSLTVSTRTWRAVKLEVRKVRTNTLILRYVASEFKRYNSGIWLPTHISITRFNKTGVKVGTISYSLVEASFNDSAHLTHINHPVPEGTILHDFRFGVNNVAPYRVVHQIPSDDHVRTLLSTRAE